MRVKNIPLFLIASILFGLKTYIVYRFVFNVEINNLLQEIIILINPFITSFIFFGITIWFRSTIRQKTFIIYGALFGTLIIYFNLIFYRSFTDFLTIPQLFQTKNMLDLSTSIISLINLSDLFLFTDVFIIWIICQKTVSLTNISFNRKFKRMFLTCVISLLAFNILLIEIERPQLFSRSFDREYLVKNIGVFYYHIYDAVMQTKVQAQRAFADENEIEEVKKYINDNVRSSTTSELFGVAEGRNVIFISAESIQTFVIDNHLHDEEVTPFLNQLKQSPDTYYFENFYHQTAQGKTSDSEFITENSLYPTSRGAVFFTHAANKYYSLANMLSENDYYSAVLHANNESFWNRNQMYEQLKIDKFFSEEEYTITDESSVGWGLKDKPFFTQSINQLEALPKPFYAKLITLTNHFPFELEEQDRTLEPYDSQSSTLNNYFSTVRYTDEAIQQFFNDLKSNGLYDKSIIIIMGDHDGISANHNRAMSEYLNKDEITPYDYIQLQRVPFLIHIPHHNKGKQMSKIAGQIDIKPTIAHLLGIKTNHDIYFGNDLFHNERKSFIALRNGDFISDTEIFTNETCYDRETGDVIWSESDKTTNDQSACKQTEEQVKRELQHSDNIIYGDLFRFINFNQK